MSKIFCVNCGHELFSYDKFCTACGTQVPHAQTAGNVPSSSAQPAQAGTAASVPGQTVSAQPPKTKGNFFGLYIWIIVGVILLLCLIGSILLIRSVTRKSLSAFSSARESSFLRSESDSDLLHDLKELHSATKELKRSWHDDVEKPYKNLKSELKKGLPYENFKTEKGILSDLDYLIKSEEAANAHDLRAARQWLSRIKDDETRRECLDVLKTLEELKDADNALQKLQDLDLDSSW